MKIVPSAQVLIKFYVFMLVISLAACIYAVLKPGITSPLYPDAKMNRALRNINSRSLISSKKTVLDKDSSDRKVSPLFTYDYDDGSQILATIIRVRKRDDFKIETYGLLTKNIDPIYIKNSNIILSNPPSIQGFIGKNKFIQTCIIPNSTRLEDSDFRLANLTATVERLNPHNNTLLSKILGTKKIIDYSCLVFTYKPGQNLNEMPPKDWQEIVRNVQGAVSY